MNDQPSGEKVINFSLSQIKYELLTIQSSLERYSGGLRRICEDVKKVEAKDPISIPIQSFDGLSLTGKVKFLEDLSKEVGLALGCLNDKFDNLI
jgi:hypothetical protein